jgi:hypothetical protein
MMSKLRKVLTHAITGYIPDGIGHGGPPPSLNQIKEEAKPENSQSLKQEDLQGSSTISGSPNRLQSSSVCIRTNLSTRSCSHKLGDGGREVRRITGMPVRE